MDKIIGQIYEKDHIKPKVGIIQQNFFLSGPLRRVGLPSVQSLENDLEQTSVCEIRTIFLRFLCDCYLRLFFSGFTTVFAKYFCPRLSLPVLNNAIIARPKVSVYCGLVLMVKK